MSFELKPLEPVYFDLRQSEWEQNRTRKCEAISASIRTMADVVIELARLPKEPNQYGAPYAQAFDLLSQFCARLHEQLIATYPNP